MQSIAPDAAERFKRANVEYHDAAASEYDSKWGIDFGPLGRSLVREKLHKALGAEPQPFGDALEIGAGTGYFGLNLVQEGLVERLTATDISPGMLEALAGTAAELEVEVETVPCEAESLPFAEASFDLVFGHAILHHIPDLERAFAELLRVLRPGGTLAFCGEPSRYGDRVAALPKRVGGAIAPLWRRAMRAPARIEVNGAAGNGHALEPYVDVHSFAPGELRELLRGAGFAEPRISGEELLANAYGWVLRSLESSAEPDEVPELWRRFAFRSYMALARVDERLLEPHLPASLFYNLLASARKP